MIIDTIENLEKYSSLNPLFPKVVEYFKLHDMKSHELGKVQLDGTNLLVNVQETKPKTKETAKVESHKNFIDIQIPLSDVEVMGYTPLCDLPASEYNPEKDVTFYPGLAESYIAIKPGEFAIFFPQDGHAPCVSETGLKKVVVKVHI